MRFSMKSTSIWRHVLIMLALVAAVTVSSKAQAVEIGQHYAGGVVFYVDESGQHGLVAATSDLPGKYDWHNAKKACAAYSLTIGDQTYDDWFLPNSQQLHQLYVNRMAVGGFADYIYWSSSESNPSFAWTQYFGDGSQYSGYLKRSYGRVRVVRAF